jgi:hypothetical protein
LAAWRHSIQRAICDNAAMTARQIPGARLITALAAIALTGYLALVAISIFPYQPTADFYQFWGVGAVREPASLRSLPYDDRAAYSAALARLAAASSSEKLRAANALRPELDPTGTPLFYATFAGLPREYDAAQAIFLAASYLAAYLGVFALARLRGFRVPGAACLAAIACLTFAPFMVDMKVGNVNALQLGIVAAFLVFVARAAPTARGDNWAMGLLGAFVVFKPNVVLVAGALGVRHVLKWMGQARAAVATVAGLVALSLGLGAWYFADAAAWIEWVRYARRLAGTDPGIAFEAGNQSLAMLLARYARSQMPGLFGLALAFALFVAVVVVAAGPRRDGQVARATLCRASRDPLFAASFAVLLTFAASPLLWIHYLVLTLVPIAWLLRGHGRVASAGAIVAYVAMARPTIDLMLAAAPGLLAPVTLLGWLALVPGLLSFVSRLRREADGSLPAQAGLH